MRMMDNLPKWKNGSTLILIAEHMLYKVVYEEWSRTGDGSFDWESIKKEKLCTCLTEAEFIAKKLAMDDSNRYDGIKIVVTEEPSTVQT